MQRALDEYAITGITDDDSVSSKGSRTPGIPAWRRHTDFIEKYMTQATTAAKV